MWKFIGVVIVLSIVSSNSMAQSLDGCNKVASIAEQVMRDRQDDVNLLDILDDLENSKQEIEKEKEALEVQKKENEESRKELEEEYGADSDIYKLLTKSADSRIELGQAIIDYKQVFIDVRQELMISAYKTPIYRRASEKYEAIEEFRNEALLSCLEG